MVWRVSGGKVPFFLAGSFHVLRAADYPLPESYDLAWKEARHLVTELPQGASEKPESQALIREIAFLKNEKLQDLISAETWDQLKQWSGKSGYPSAALEMMKPWMASLCIVVAAYEKQGFQSTLGVERHFAERLAKSDKTSEGLETFEQQMRLFDGVSLPLQEEMLKLTLQQTATMEADMAALTEAWKAGDDAKVDELMSRSFEGFPELKKQMLTDRNAAWIPQLEALLKGDRATMVLVGAAHLCGPGSVVELLEQKGYRCVRVKPAAALPAPVPAPVKKAA